ncbi:ABC transporter permease [Cellulosimicrobium cellulans]|uniref:ABC transporter permease n=1 Tax=Cellulosimicrobium cellulans TaxID=1710 RepID=UPI0036EB6152
MTAPTARPGLTTGADPEPSLGTADRPGPPPATGAPPSRDDPDRPPAPAEDRSRRAGDRLRALAPALVPLAAVLGALAVSTALASLAGATPAQAAAALWEGMVGTPYAIGSSVNVAAMLLLVATGFLVAHRAGLVNVGGEGQICVGAVAATAVGTALPPAVPAVVALPLVLLVAALGGAAWASVAAWLAVRRGVSEVITTLLLNFVGAAVLVLAVHEEALLRQPVTSSETLPQSSPLVDAAHLPLLGLPGSPATVGVVLALAAALVASVVLRRTATGVRLAAVGQSRAASLRLGLPVDRLRFTALSTAGATAGLAGGVLVASAPHVLDDGLSSGYGFSGLVVGLLARGSFAAAAGIATALGFLVSGGINLQLAAGVPASITQITESLVILGVAGTAIWAVRRPAGVRPRSRRRPQSHDRPRPGQRTLSHPSSAPTTEVAP